MVTGNSSVTVFAPASVSNVGPGFDILGFAIEGMGDKIRLSLNNDGQYSIQSIGAELPLNPDKNVATVALKALARDVGYKGGFDIKIEKGFAPGSGLGSSASSAVGAVFAANQLLSLGYSKEELIPYALDGEQVASGNRHADNIAPCMLGGFVAVRSCDPFDGFQIPVPSDLKVLIIFPDVPIKTSDARNMLPNQVPLAAGIAQAANMGALVKGLMSSDYQLIGDALTDAFAQPFRKQLIPLFDEVEALVKGNGAAGFTISGSGPAMFGFFRGDIDLEPLKQQIAARYEQREITVRFHESGINERGVEIING